MRKLYVIIAILALASGSLHAKPPKHKTNSMQQLGIRLWSELGKRALIHHARKRLNDVTQIDEQLKEDYIATNAKATVAIILYEFASGSGPDTRYFYDGQPFTEEFKQGPAMQYMLATYSALLDSTDCDTIRNGRYQFSGRAIPFVWDTWPFCLQQHYLTLKQVNMSQFVVGSFNYSVEPGDSGALKIHVWNTTSRRSLFIGIPNRVQRPMILGNIYQHIFMELQPEELKELSSEEKG